MAGKYDHIDRKPTKGMYTAALNALEKRKKTPKSQRGGLDPKEAKAQGIDSGVTRARQIVDAWRNKRDLSWDTWGKIAGFSRFDGGGNSPRRSMARGLWGGRGGTARARQVMRQKAAADKKS